MEPRDRFECGVSTITKVLLPEPAEMESCHANDLIFSLPSLLFSREEPFTRAQIPFFVHVFHAVKEQIIMPSFPHEFRRSRNVRCVCVETTISGGRSKPSLLDRPRPNVHLATSEFSRHPKTKKHIRYWVDKRKAIKS